MQNIQERPSTITAGMYLLETLTSGMYNNPLSIYREYIQNSIDSIDISERVNGNTPMEVNIDLDPIKRRIRFFDNGFGIPAEIAELTLCAIGNSNKIGNGLRGFRGIGRLGGIAFSDKTIFRTKSKNETFESIQEWDCKGLRAILSNSKSSPTTLQQLFEKTTNFYQRNGQKPDESYFEVILEDVTSFRNYIFDIERVRKYLSQIAPVPFNPEDFSYSNEINDYLSQNLSSYGQYLIKINGEQIRKPYRNKVKITKKGYDYIDGIKLIELNIMNTPVAYGWYGNRRDLLGGIAKGEESSGIRVRVGNLLLGDAHLLDGCFRESRFNGYVIGEIHVDCPDLIPNSRRDDFIDNEAKTLFYNEVEKVIGLPISKLIRQKSRVHPKNIVTVTEMSIFDRREEENKTSINFDQFWEKIEITCSHCEKLEMLRHVLEKEFCNIC